MRTKYAIFVGGENCYANLDGGHNWKDGQPTYMFNPFIQEESAFDTSEQAAIEALRIGLTQFSVMTVQFA